MSSETSLRTVIDSSTMLMNTFKSKAPGTHRHGLNVAQLGESIAKELGLDVDAFVVAATLHDIGKSLNAETFIENQSGVNIHDALEPSMSYQLISRHVSDSVLILTQLDLPPKIIKMVSEHHGNTLMKSIYSKAKARCTATAEAASYVSEEMFRYKSNVPSTVESCLLMICDVIESTSRALYASDKLDDPKAVVDKMIADMTDQKQLDMLTIGTLRVIQRQLYRELESIYHKRLDYDAEAEKTQLSATVLQPA